MKKSSILLPSVMGSVRAAFSHKPNTFKAILQAKQVSFAIDSTQNK